jgi:hypothetical protein
MVAGTRNPLFPVVVRGVSVGAPRDAPMRGDDGRLCVVLDGAATGLTKAVWETEGLCDEWPKLAISFSRVRSRTRTSVPPEDRILPQTSSSQFPFNSVSALIEVAPDPPTRVSKSIPPLGVSPSVGPLTAVAERSSMRCESRKN